MSIHLDRPIGSHVPVFHGDNNNVYNVLRSKLDNLKYELEASFSIMSKNHIDVEGGIMPSQSTLLTQPLELELELEGMYYSISF